jgi:cytosine/adenosine deaminase-related metal-dependent hydrolase
MALECATAGGAACLGRSGEIGVIAPGAVADVAVWRLTGPAFAGALADPIEAWLRCGPVAAWHTFVNGRRVVREGNIVHPDLDEVLRTHSRHAARIQGLAD